MIERFKLWHEDADDGCLDDDVVVIGAEVIELRGEQVFLFTFPGASFDEG